MDKWYEVVMVCATIGSVVIAFIFGCYSAYKVNKEFKRDMARHTEKMRELEGHSKSLKGQYIDKVLLFGNDNLGKEELWRFKQNLPHFSKEFSEFTCNKEMANKSNSMWEA